MMKWLWIECPPALWTGSCRVTFANGTFPTTASKCPVGNRMSANDSARTSAAG